MRGTRARMAVAAMAASAAVIAGVSIAGASVAGAVSGGATGSDDDVVLLAPIVAAWPEEYSVVGSKSEPLYTERIAFSRDGDRFALRIDVVAQGDTPLGIQRGAVSVADDGTVAWVAGCTKDAEACSADPALRGFLTTAALVGLERSGNLPEVGTARTLHGTPVVCVDDDAVHPDAAPSIAGLDPCFSVETGALLGHWSAGSTAFVGPTLAPGFAEATGVDRALFAEVIP